MADVAATDSLVFVESMTMEISSVPVIYGSVAGADRYFSELLYGQLWSITSLERKNKALVQATRMLESLPFYGNKYDETQALSFPRNSSTTTPAEVEQATYELANALLKGADAETERRQLFVKTRKFGRIQTDYDWSSGAPEHIVAGIPCLESWRLIRPFLSPNLSLTLRRGS